MCKGAQKHGFLGLNAYLGLHSPITGTFPSNRYWGVDASFKYGGANGNVPRTILKNTAGIIDTGTTLLYIATGMLLRFSGSYRICAQG